MLFTLTYEMETRARATGIRLRGSTTKSVPVCQWTRRDCDDNLRPRRLPATVPVFPPPAARARGPGRHGRWVASRALRDPVVTRAGGAGQASREARGRPSDSDTESYRIGQPEPLSGVCNARCRRSRSVLVAGPIVRLLA